MIDLREVNMEKIVLMVIIFFALVSCSSVKQEDRKKLTTEQLIEKSILISEDLKSEDTNYSYKVFFSDLNDDDQKEILVMNASDFCDKNSCNGYLFSAEGTLINKIKIMNNSLWTSNTTKSSHGWKDLYILDCENRVKLLEFDGSQYQLNLNSKIIVNRKKEREEARKILTGTELYIQDGYCIKSIPSPILSPLNNYKFSFKHYGDPLNLYVFKIDMFTKKYNLTKLPMN